MRATAHTTRNNIPCGTSYTPFTRRAVATRSLSDEAHRPTFVKPSPYGRQDVASAEQMANARCIKCCGTGCITCPECEGSGTLSRCEASLPSTTAHGDTTCRARVESDQALVSHIKNCGSSWHTAIHTITNGTHSCTLVYKQLLSFHVSHPRTPHLHTQRRIPSAKHVRREARGWFEVYSDGDHAWVAPFPR